MKFEPLLASYEEGGPLSEIRTQRKMVRQEGVEPSKSPEFKSGAFTV